MQAEMEGISSYTKIDIGTLATIGAIYDLTAYAQSSHHACTSIVVQNTKGEIIHGRNLDYHLKVIMENITSIVDFQRGGHTIFTSVSYIGMPAFNTLMKPG